jgi:inhibitor of KinA
MPDPRAASAGIDGPGESHVKLQPLGDQAYLATMASEAAAVALTEAIRRTNPHWLQDVVPAYASVGIYFDADISTSQLVADWLNALSVTGTESATVAAVQSHAIPVCYERQQDMARVCERTGLTPDEVIRLHTTAEFTVYAIGFVPGFPYLGYLPPELTGVPRLPAPRVRVDAGSVGLTGRQTGIYPLPRPGGWNLIGQTPRVLVDVADQFFPLQVGDRVRFIRIDEREYTHLEGERLEAKPRQELPQGAPVCESGPSSLARTSERR